MPLLDGSHEAASENSLEYWQNELKNSRILLFKVNQAISAITTANHQSYELDTGQTKQRVTRADLPSLIEQRKTLTSEIRNLEMYLGEGKPSVIQGRPDW